MGRLGRVTRVALWINAVLHTVGCIGFLVGPETSGAMARRTAGAGLAAAFMMVFVAQRLSRDARLIALPIAFVLGNLAVSVYDFALLHDTRALAPAFFETVFLVLYTAFALGQRSAMPAKRQI